MPVSPLTTYSVSFSDPNKTPIVVPPETLDTTSTSITLFGHGTILFGEDQQTNFLNILENFANDTSPNNPISGQIWYDSLNDDMKYYDGSVWKSVGGNLVLDFPIPDFGQGPSDGLRWYSLTSLDEFKIYSQYDNSTDAKLVIELGNEQADGLKILGTSNQTVLDVQAGSISTFGGPVNINDNNGSSILSIINNPFQFQGAPTLKFVNPDLFNLAESMWTELVISVPHLDSQILNISAGDGYGSLDELITIDAFLNEITLYKAINIFGSLNMYGNGIHNIAAPTFIGDATNKEYVDNGLALKAPIDSPNLTGIPTTPTPVLSDSSTKIASTEFVQKNLPNRNLIINGDFSVWQRGTSFTKTSISYTVDRWICNFTDSYTVTRGDFTPGQTVIPGNPKHYFSLTKTGTADNVNIEQRIEGAMPNETFTISGYIRSNVSLTNCVIGMYMYFDNGNISTGVTSTVTAPANVWTRFEVTVTNPNWIGGASNGSDFTAVYILPDGTNINWTGTFELSQIQVERGFVATEFEVIDKSLQKLKCQRYYQQSYPEGTPPGSIIDTGKISCEENNVSNTLHNIGKDFVCEMRTVPTMIAYSHVDGAANNITVNSTNLQVQSIDINVKRFDSILLVSPSPSSGISDQYFLQYTVDAEL